jgi:hypothetical protein
VVVVATLSGAEIVEAIVGYAQRRGWETKDVVVMVEGDEIALDDLEARVGVEKPGVVGDEGAE